MAKSYNNITSRHWKLIASIAFTLATVWLIIRADAISSIGNAIAEIQTRDLIIVALLFACMRITQALSLHRTLRLQSVRISFVESSNLAALKGFYNLGFSGAGLVAQAIHARTRNLFSVHQLAWASLYQSALLLSAIGILLAAFSAVFIPNTSAMSLLVTIGTLAAVSPLLAYYLVRGPLETASVLPHFLQTSADQFTQMMQNASLTDPIRILLLQLTLASLRVARIAFIGFALDPQLTVGVLATVTLASDLATVIPITPGGVGVREFLIGIGAGLLGNFEIFMAAAVIDRGVTIAGNLIHGSWVLTMQLVRRGTPNKP